MGKTVITVVRICDFIHLFAFDFNLEHGAKSVQIRQHGVLKGQLRLFLFLNKSLCYEYLFESPCRYYTYQYPQQFFPSTCIFLVLMRTDKFKRVPRTYVFKGTGENHTKIFNKNVSYIPLVTEFLLRDKKKINQHSLAKVILIRSRIMLFF